MRPRTASVPCERARCDGGVETQGDFQLRSFSRVDRVQEKCEALDNKRKQTRAGRSSSKPGDPERLTFPPVSFQISAGRGIRLAQAALSQRGAVDAVFES
jgi:hypothetical protein